jgi:hypothetical protein
VSLSGYIPVPQYCRMQFEVLIGAGRKRGWLPWGSRCDAFEFGSAQAKPSTVRCSCQTSGRPECARSLSAVKSGSWRPSKMACVMSGVR